MKSVGIVTAAVMCIIGIAHGEIPFVMNHQGMVTYSNGDPVPDGSYAMRFKIYDNASGSGSPLWDSGNHVVAVSGGVFNVMLGESPQPSLGLTFNQDYWLLVTFAGEDQTPLVRIGSVGYAYMSSGLVPGTEVSGTITSGTAAAVKGTNLATSGYNYGLIGESRSSSGRGVYGLGSSTTGQNYGGYFESSSSSGTGIHAWATSVSGTTYGVHGQSSSTDGSGVFGEATAGTGVTSGVLGRSSSTSGMGVRGIATATSGWAYGVWGESSSTGGVGVYGQSMVTSGVTYAVRGDCMSSDGRGVYGVAIHTAGTTYGGYFVSLSETGRGVLGIAEATYGTNYGVVGQTESSEGRGVYGLANASTGYNYGVCGISHSGEGRGVYGVVDATTGANYGAEFENWSTAGGGVCGTAHALTGYTYGVYGIANSTTGDGVYGLATATTGNAYGVLGYSSSASGVGVFGNAHASSGVTYGVYGVTHSASGYGGFFDGDVHVTGDITKNNCYFLIDHPLDPENKLLRHSCVESPENLLIYRGTETLNSQGEARVGLPDYFVALVAEQKASVHVTPRGRPFVTGYDWNADKSGVVLYGTPNREVSWMVLADRDDPVTREHAHPVEEDKGPESRYCDRGRLLYPSAYGYPATRGREFDQRKDERHQRR